MKSFSAVGSFPVRGVINSLQVVSPLKGSLADASWAWGQTGEDGPRIASGPSIKQKSGPVLLVAGVGQEPRLGRWVTVKGDGSRNCALVMVLHPRTLT
jgi:ribosomal RNA-processing protein 9